MTTPPFSGHVHCPDLQALKSNPLPEPSTASRLVHCVLDAEDYLRFPCYTGWFKDSFRVRGFIGTILLCLVVNTPVVFLEIRHAKPKVKCGWTRASFFLARTFQSLEQRRPVSLKPIPRPLSVPATHPLIPDSWPGWSCSYLQSCCLSSLHINNFSMAYMAIVSCQLL